MSTKFISKNSNYMIVLKPGVEGNRALGTHSIPGLYIKFQAGMVDIRDEEVVASLREHPSFGTAFVEVKDNETDPYATVREDIEPGHSTTEIKYGQAGKKTGATAKIQLTPQLKKVIETEAIKMIPDLLKSNPKILKDIIFNLAKDMKEQEKETASIVKETESVIVDQIPDEAPKVEDKTKDKKDK